MFVLQVARIILICQENNKARFDEWTDPGGLFLCLQSSFVVLIQSCISECYIELNTHKMWASSYFERGFFRIVVVIWLATNLKQRPQDDFVWQKKASSSLCHPQWTPHVSLLGFLEIHVMKNVNGILILSQKVKRWQKPENLFWNTHQH